MDLPSMTGMAASAPMLPRPSTAEPSVTTAMVLPRLVRLYDSVGSAWMAMHTDATPGVYAMDRSSSVSTVILDAMLTLPRLSRCRRIASEP